MKKNSAKNLKYAKIGLAVGALDQFVIKFRGLVSLLERLKTFTFLPTLNVVLANVDSPV